MLHSRNNGPDLEECRHSLRLPRSTALVGPCLGVSLPSSVLECSIAVCGVFRRSVYGSSSSANCCVDFSCDAQCRYWDCLALLISTHFAQPQIGVILNKGPIPTGVFTYTSADVMVEVTSQHHSILKVSISPLSK